MKTNSANKEVLKRCPNFYNIINFEYYSHDIISEKLIDVYSQYIFSTDVNNSEDMQNVEKLDRALYKYISDYCFREQIKKDIVKVKVHRGEDVLKSIVDAIIKFFECYDTFCLRKVQVTRWI